MKRYLYIAGVLVVVWMVLSAIFPLFFGSSWGDLKITPQLVVIVLIFLIFWFYRKRQENPENRINVADTAMINEELAWAQKGSGDQNRNL